VRAIQVDGGYRFTGRVPFVSGSAHATWLFAAAAVFDGDKPREAADGGPVLVSGIFRPEQATILDTWHVSGMRATSSNDVLIDNLFIPSEMAFPLSHIPSDRDPLAALPLLSRLGAGLSFVALGVATHAIDLLIELAALKQPLRYTPSTPRSG